MSLFGYYHLKLSKPNLKSNDLRYNALTVDSVFREANTCTYRRQPSTTTHQTASAMNQSRIGD